MAAIELRPHQLEAKEASAKALARGVRRQLFVLPTACHRAGQGVLLFDGSVKRVEEIEVGDALMGPDSKPRVVQQLARGVGEMASVVPIKGDPWVVNLDHMLTLVRTNIANEGSEKYRYPCYRPRPPIDLTIRDWLGWSRTKRLVHKLFRVPVEFPARPSTLPLSPYFMGIYLGDGSCFSAGPVICKPDPEIEHAVREEAARLGMHVRVSRPADRCVSYRISGTPNRPNAAGRALEALGLHGVKSGEKFVPAPYRIGSRNERLEILAGLIDTDGHYGAGSYDYISKSERLARDVAFLARSLGLAAYTKSCQKYCQTGAGGTYWRVQLSGDLEIIPCRIPRKQAGPRRQKKDVLRTGFTVVPTGTTEPFFGFTLDGDGRYLLDDFTVTHNSGKTLLFCSLVGDQGGRALVLVHSRELIQQSAEKLRVMIPGAQIGVVRADRNEHRARIVVATIQTLAQPHRLQQITPDFRTVVADEAHRSVGETWRTVLSGVRCFEPDGPLLIGCTATPGRSDRVGLSHIFEEIVYERGIVEMIAAGFLSDLRAKRVGMKFDLGGMKFRSQSELDDASSEAMMAVDGPRHIAEAWLQYAPDRKGIAFLPRIDVSKATAEAFCAAGVSAEHLDGTTPDRERAGMIERLRSGATRVLCNVAVLTEGADIPSVDAIVLGRATKSQGLFTQMIGRGLRKWPGKQDLAVLDVSGATDENNLVSVSSLFGLPLSALQKGRSVGEVLEEREKQGQQTKINGRVVAVDVDLLRDRGAQWISSGKGSYVMSVGESGLLVIEPANVGFRIALQKRDRTEELLGEAPTLDLALGIAEGKSRKLGKHVQKLTDPQAAWRQKPASQKQRETLARMRVACPPEMTAGQASDLISQRVARARDWDRKRAAR